jgi:hypothetical protein
MTSLPCKRLLLKGSVFKGLHKGGGLPIELMPIIENHNHDRHDITKTQEKTSVVSIGLENGGVIVMATKKPHEGNVNVQGDFEIIVTRAMPSLV